MSRMENFILDHGEDDSYAEPRTDLHDSITAETAEEIAKLFPDKGRVLDIGCGQGPALDWFSKNGFNIIGITTNRDDLMACIDKEFDVSLCDQNEMPPMWSGLFDLVWARHVLEHSIAPFWTLHEFFRVLKPGGILYLEMPAPDTAANHSSNPNHYSVLGWKMWACLIDRSRFEILEAKQRQLEIENVGSDVYFSFICRKV